MVANGHPSSQPSRWGINSLRLYLLIACLLGGPAASASIQQIHDYTVRLNDGFSSLSVSACFDGPFPDSLFAGSSQARPLLRNAHIRQSGERRRVEVSGSQMRLPDRADDDCVHYQVDLGKAARARSIGIAARTGDALVLSPQIWLWRPRSLNPYIDIRLHFEREEGMDIQGPWQADPDWLDASSESEAEDQGPVFRLGYPPLGWDSDFIMGRFERFQLDSEQTRVTVAKADGPGERADMTLTRQWLQAGLEAAESIFGQLPSERGQVIIVPLDSGDRPVARGRVSRAGGLSMSLGMNGHQPESDYQADGLIAHEFIHWLHPPVASDHRWLPEGLATYYQYIGLARAGHLSPAEAWQRFMEDMDDGIWDRRPGTVLDIARRMNREGGADYVYWASAAMMLIADVELRRRSDKQQSLDHILAQWVDCCFDQRRSADGRDVMDRLDELAGGEPIFRPLYDDHVLSVGFPDIEQLLESLGLPQAGETFELNEEAPLAPIRRAIMQPHEEPLLP
ncbi:hypothetical protein J2T60_002444 [Natronospira proteinivora]|uniref:Peptidase M61 catalytic domain-containing protein n=1 Tax=Natronospira proteinivora TaxID=1807133 RepID=A0ABT1GAT7_9GAMM|nr:hypothetical protein [Natronospira proteinivora]MCP1728444.1 hypothetical protein [Natronospira proteinivora]